MSQTVTRASAGWRAELYHESARLAGLAFDRYEMNPCQRLYLVGERDRRHLWGDFDAAGEGDPRPCVCGEPVPRNLPREAIRGWIESRLPGLSLALIADAT